MADVTRMNPSQIIFDSRIAAAFALVLMGVAIWEVLSTIAFDWSIISRQRKWRWPMLAYFVARVCMLTHITGQAVNLNALYEIPCQQVVLVTKVADVIGTFCVTVILVLRTIAIWHQSKAVIGGLCLLAAGQLTLWAMSLQYSRSEWNPQHKGCAVLQTAPRPFLISLFTYTLGLDAIILALCTYRLTSASRRGGISTLLLKEGIAYFVAAFGANLIETIFAAMNLNPVMNIMCLPFALVASVIAATRAFRHLYTIHDDLRSTQASSDSRGPSSRNGFGGIPGSRARGFAQPGLALNDLRRDGTMPPISVHKVVEVDADPGLGTPVGYDHDVESFTYDSEEKRRHITAL